MSGSSLFALIDDIATLLDDVATLTKVATKKTAGVLGDDLAVNAEQAAGVTADRELPVVWAVAKGSALNKLILVPSALCISWLAPWAVVPVLMLGGAFLCWEGFEKVVHAVARRRAHEGAERAARVAAVADPHVDMLAFEREKIKGAVRTDLVLSSEIVAITLGTVATKPLTTQLAVLTTIAVIMTVGVYGLVAAIVRLDDLGLHLSRRSNALAKSVGSAILTTAPYLMRGLTVVGTLAMFLVGGGILAHGVPRVHHGIETLAENVGGLGGSLLEPLLNGLIGALVGAVLTALLALGALLRNSWRTPSSSQGR